MDNVIIIVHELRDVTSQIATATEEQSVVVNENVDDIERLGTTLVLRVTN
ncbi:MAG: methyl-accepting chemotaxis protein [Alteromonadaceae bacterium]|jgi:methyl-accepting chemotaxis protein